MTPPAPAPTAAEIAGIQKRHDDADREFDIGGVKHRGWKNENGWPAHADRATLLRALAAVNEQLAQTEQSVVFWEGKHDAVVTERDQLKAVAERIVAKWPEVSKR